MLLRLTVMIVGSAGPQCSPAGSTPRVGGDRGWSLFVHAITHYNPSYHYKQHYITANFHGRGSNQSVIGFDKHYFLQHLIYVCKSFYQYWTKSVCLMQWWRFHARRAGMRNTSKIKLLSIYLKRMVFQLFLWAQTVGYLAVTRATPLVSLPANP